MDVDYKIMIETGEIKNVAIITKEGKSSSSFKVLKDVELTDEKSKLMSKITKAVRAYMTIDPTLTLVKVLPIVKE